MNRETRRAIIAANAPSRAAVAKEQRNGVLVHELIAKVAKDLSRIFYDKACTKSNNMYKAFPNEDAFVATQWPDFIAEARMALTNKLADPGTPADQKEFIYDAICLDRTCPKSQTRGMM